MKKTATLLFFLLSFIFSANAQNDKTKATLISKAASFKIAPSINSRTDLILAILDDDSEVQDGRSSRHVIIPSKGNKSDDILAKKPHTLSKKIDARTPSLVFDAIASSSAPTDPSGAVGPNHYLVVFNTGFRIFDKQGIALTTELSPDNIFSSGGCCDLTISYDNAADRWVMSILYYNGNVEVAVSKSSNPVTTQWNVYTFTNIQDYQKLSVWSDGYYMTANAYSNSASTSNVVFAFEKDQMIAGNPNAQMVAFPLPGIVTSGFYSPQAFNVSNNNLPANGSMPIVYFQDDNWTGVTNDHLKLWEVDVDWNTPTNSVISSVPLEFSLTPFVSVFDNGSFANLQQPNGGSDIDALQATIMNQAQFRKFTNHNSALFNFVVDVDVTNEQAGIRWIELRQSGDGQPWNLYQEGTYTSPNNKHAWMASLIMDSQGNIGMGYSGMGGINNETLSVYYTGRYANDPLGTMTINEELIAVGNGNINGFRYGDYSKIDVDPTDDKTFWFINEYSNNGVKDVVGVFKIAADLANDVGVINLNSPISATLTSNETVTITIFNYGLSAASNFDVSYQVDGGTVITETFTGTLASQTTAQYTFTTPVNIGVEGQTYTFICSTHLNNDEDNSNNFYTTNVTHLVANDIGVTAISSPVSGTSLTVNENITITITNFGGVAQSNFDVSYSINGNTITETLAGTINTNTTLDYTFTQTGDFSALGTYNMTATTLLNSDVDNTNNTFTTTVIKSNCQPNADCSYGDGLRLFQLGTINNVSGCEGYGNFTNLLTDLVLGSTNTLTVGTNYANQHLNVWIDFNDDFVFDINELVVTDFIFSTASDITDLIIPANVTLGSHLLRAKVNWNNSVPDDACEETSYGETEDYMVNIVSTASVDDKWNDGANLLVSDIDNNNIFDVILQTETFTDKMTLTVFDTLGKRIVYYDMKNDNGLYKYTLDMTYIAKGVYLVRVGNKQYGKVKRIIVK